jgi:phosphoribosylformylglycinamidine synthase
MRDAIARFRELPAQEQARRRADVRVLILTGLGLNCEAETEAAFRMVGARPERIHLLDVLEGNGAPRLADYPILAFVGGFAFGDHMGAGFVFANKIRWRLYDQLLEFIDGGGLALGICNGFQTMVRLGMLPGLDGDYRTPRATLAPNDRLGYRDAWVRLAFDPNSPCVWTYGLSEMELPARHGEGKFLTEGRRRLRPLGTAVRPDAAPRRLPVSLPPSALASPATRDRARRRRRRARGLPQRRRRRGGAVEPAGLNADERNTPRLKRALATGFYRLPKLKRKPACRVSKSPTL